MDYFGIDEDPFSKPKPLRKYMTVTQAAAYFGVATVQVSEWIKSGELEGFWVGNSGRIQLEEVRRFRRENLKKALMKSKSKFGSGS